MTILRKIKKVKLKRLIKSSTVIVLVLSNLLFGFPAQAILNATEDFFKDSKVVDLMYWATKDREVVDNFISDGMPNVIKEAKAVSATHTEVFNSTNTWIAPTGVTSVDAQAWGGGGAGAGDTPTNDGGQPGGGGGAYARTDNISVSAGSSYAVTVGTGGTPNTGTGSAGGDSGFNDNSQIIADGGTAGVDTNHATNGTGGTLGNTIGADEEYAGGDGGDCWTKGKLRNKETRKLNTE